MKVLVYALCAMFTAPAFAQSLPVTVRSPDTKVVLKLVQDAAGQLSYSIERNGETVIAPSALRLRLAEGDVSSVDARQANPRSIQQVHKLVATKASEARDDFNEITIVTAPRSRAVRTLHWIFRVYDDGVAFRFRVPGDAGLSTLPVAQRGHRIHVRRGL